MLWTCGSSGQLTTCRSSPVPGKQVGVYLKREADATVAERKAAHSVTPKVACFVGLDKGLGLFSNKRPREYLLRPWAWSERSCLMFLVQGAWVATFLTGCEDLMRQMPAGTDRMIQSGIGVGGAILNRPKFSEADEEKMAQENARKFEHANKVWDDPLLDAYL